MDLYLAVKSQIGPAVLQSLLQISGNKCQLLHAKASLQNSSFFEALRILILEAERETGLGKTFPHSYPASGSSRQARHVDLVG